MPSTQTYQFGEKWNIQRERYQPAVLVETAGLSEKEWLEWRRKGIGGSDASAVLGISPFATARDLYYDKLHILPYEDSDENWVQKEVGHLLENLVARIFSQKTGLKIYQIKKMFYHPKYPFMLADIDYFVELPGGTTAILEIKTTNYNAREHWYKNGSEIVPVNYEAQGRHYMCVMDIDQVFFCCYYGDSNEVIIRSIKRDYDYEDELIALEKDFWINHVLAQKEPPYTEDGTLILASVKNHFGSSDPNAASLKLSLSSANRVLQFNELQTKKKIAESEVKKYEAEMKLLQGMIVAEMGKSCTAECLADGKKYQITYQPSYRCVINKDSLLRLQIQHPDIYNEYVTKTVSHRFSVKKSLEVAA